MGDLKSFLKSNKKEKKTTQYPATKSLCDKDGNPLMWTIRALSTKESEAIREACSIEVPITGKPGMMRQKLKTHEYVSKLVAAAVVEPDLQNSELQDSYGVKTPEDLLMEMLDNPVEFSDFATFVQEYSGLDESFQDKVNEAKN